MAATGTETQIIIQVMDSIVSMCDYDRHRDTNSYTSHGFICEYCVARTVTEAQIIIKVRGSIVSIVWLRQAQRHK